MKITCNHSASSYGMPVILGDDGKLMDYPQGIKSLRAKLGLSTTQLADLCGKSRRTIEGYEAGKLPDAAALNVMGALLSK